MRARVSQNRMIFFWLIILLLGAELQPAVSPSEAERRQITTHPEIDLAPRLSPDGEWLAFVSKRSGNYDIWLRNMRTGFERQMTTHRADDFYPVWDVKQRYLIYVSQSSDAHGDLFRLNLRSVRGELIAKGEPERLTFYLGFDGYPTMSAFDEHIAWVSDRTGRPEIWLQTKKRLDIRQLTHGGATHPAWSPVQDYLAFTSFRQDSSNGDIWLLNLYAPLELFETKLPTDSLERPMWPITRGPMADGFPTWTADAHKVLFARHAFDTNGDGHLTPADKSVLWSADISYTPIDSARVGNPSFEMFRESFDERIALAARPLTPLYYDAQQPDYGTDARTYFTASLNGNSDVWSADISHFISPDSTAVFDFLESTYPLPRHLRSQQLDSLLTVNPADLTEQEQRRLWDRLTALQQIFDVEKTDDHTKASALYEGGICLILLGCPDQARIYLAQVMTAYSDAAEQAAWAELALEGIESSAESLTNDLIDAALMLQQKYSSLTEFQAQTEILLGRLYTKKLDRVNAERHLAPVQERFAQYPEYGSESRYLLGRLYERLGESDRAAEVYVATVQTYAEKEWTLRSRDRLIAISIEGVQSDQGRLAAYRSLHERFSEFKMISAEPLFRAAALSVRMHNYDAALEIYDSMVHDYAELPEIIFAARKESVELLLRIGEFVQAADELGALATDYAESFPQLAQEANDRLVQLLLESARDLKASGNYAVAALRYQRVLDLDAYNLMAHKGYIECMFNMNSIQQVVNDYEQLNKAIPNNNILLYALGLAYSYRGTRVRDGVYLASDVVQDDLERSNDLLRKALSFDYNQIEAYLTLSYNYEMLENFQIWEKGKPKKFLRKAGDAISAPVVWLFHTVTFYNETKAPRYFESAIQILTSALALNDEEKRPDLEAAVALNMANNYYNLGEYGFSKAYDFYHLRMRYDSTFADVRQEALIKERMGHCAMVVSDLEHGPDYLKRTIALYREMNDQNRVLVNIKRLALLYEFGGDSQQALVYYQQAADIEAQRNLYDGLLRSYRSLAFHHYLLNEKDEAVFYANKALAMLDEGLVQRSEGKPIRPQFGILGIYLPIPYDLRKVGAKSILQLSTDEEEAILYTILAEAFRQDRQFESAIAFYEKKLKIYEERFDYNAQAIFQNNMAYLYFVKGDYDNAWKWFTNSYWMCRSAKNVGGQLLNIANAAHVVMTIVEEPDQRKRIHLAKYHNWITGKIREMLNLTEETQSLYALNRTHLYMLLSDLLMVTIEDAAQADVEARLNAALHTIHQSHVADTLLSSALKLAQQLKLPAEEAAIHFKKGQLYDALGENDDALAEFIECRKIATQNELTDMQWQVNTAIGKIVAVHSSDLLQTRNDALHYFQQAIQISEANRAKTPGISVARHRQQVQEPYREAIKFHVARGSTLQALQMAERMRERSYLDILGDEKLDLGVGVRQELYVQADSLMKAMNDLEFALLQPGQQSSKAREGQRKLATLRTEYSEVMEQIRSQAPEIESLIKITPVNLEQLQSQLPDSLALLYQIVDAKESFNWVMTRDTLSFFSTPFDKIEVARTWPALQMDSLQSMPDAFAALFQHLGSFSIDKVVFIPDHDFLLYPWTLVAESDSSMPVISSVSSSLTAFAMALQNSRPGGYQIYLAPTSPEMEAALGNYDIISPVPQQSGNVFFAQRALFSQADIIHLNATLGANDVFPGLAEIVYQIPQSQPAIIKVNDLYALKSGGAAHLTFVQAQDGAPILSPEQFIAWERAFYFGDFSSFLLVSHAMDSTVNFSAEFYRELSRHPVDGAIAMACSTLSANGQLDAKSCSPQLYGFGGSDARDGSESVLLSAKSLQNLADVAFSDREWAHALDLYKLVSKLDQGARQIPEVDSRMLACAILDGNWQQAIDLHRDMADRYARLNDWPAVADVQRHLVVYYEQIRDLQNADNSGSSYRRLVSEYGLDFDAAFAWQHVASICIDGGNYERAVDLLLRAASEYKQQKDVQHQTIALQQVADVYAYDIRDLDSALRHYEQVMNMARPQSARHSAAVLLDKSRVYYHYELCSSAKRHVLQALDYARQASEHDLVVQCELHLALLSFEQGDIRRTSALVDGLAEPLTAPLSIDRLLLQSRIAAEQGAVQKAESMARRAVDLATKNRDARYLVVSLLHSAVLSWYQGKHADAISASEKILASVSMHSRSSLAAHILLGVQLLDTGENEGALQYLQTALERAAHQHDDLARAQCYLHLSRAVGDSAAHVFAEKAIALSDSMGLAQILWRAHWREAQLALTEGRREDAGIHFENALRALLRSQPKTILQQLNDYFSSTEEDFFAELIEFHTAADDPLAALAVLEKLQHRSIVRTNQSNQNTFYKNAQKQAMMDSLVEGAAFNRARLLVAKRRADGREDRTFASLRQMTESIQAGMAQLMLKDGDSTQTQNYSDLIAHMPQDAAVLCTFYTETKLFLWHIRSDTIALHENHLTPDRLNESLGDLYQRLISRESVVASVQSLYNDLIAPFDLTRDQTLVIVPYGKLYYVPFSLLGTDGSAPLGLDVRLSYAISPAEALHALAQADRPAVRSIAFLTTTARTARDLSLTQNVAHSLARYFQSVTPLSVADRAADVTPAPNLVYDALFVGARLEFNSRFPYDSQVAIYSSENEQILDLNDWLASSSAPLTVFASGRVMDSFFQQGNECAGFYAGVLDHHANGILSAQWLADETASAVLIKRFFRFLSEGYPCIEALRLAQRVVYESIDAHPSAWAAYRLFGEIY
ncbi:CHAT domain-containing protein [candidate division KSB1 bacterium]|nr:CHAT domain-containing protein [candidate division KSB1 bacterium]